MKIYLNKIDDAIVKSITLLILIDITYLLLFFAHIKIFNEDPGIIFDKKYIINPSDTLLVNYNIKKHMVNNTSNKNRATCKNMCVKFYLLHRLEQKTVPLRVQKRRGYGKRL